MAYCLPDMSVTISIDPCIAVLLSCPGVFMAEQKQLEAEVQLAIAEMLWTT